MTTHSQSEQIAQSEEIEASVSRRGLVQALAAGAAAASVATPASAQQTAAQAVLAEATSADYTRDPTRWGSAEVAALFPGFKHIDMRTKGATCLPAAPALRCCCCTAAPTITFMVQSCKACGRCVGCRICAYGDSSLPEPGPN
jgi:secreted PhoX family phosphatase